MGSERHYSYAAYADPAMAESFDAKRFGGPIGQILLDDQERVLAEFLGDVSGRRILDLGTGTGRAAIALARRGALVTGIDASSEMLRVARTRAQRMPDWPSSSAKGTRTPWLFPIAPLTPRFAFAC